MTMINIGDVSVIYEGAHRLRWHYQWGRSSASFLDHSVADRGATNSRMIGSVWPDAGTRTHIRRHIEHGRKTVVIFDGQPPIATVPRKNLLSVPHGAVELDNADQDICTLLVPPLNWLGAAQCARGHAFAHRARVLLEQTPTTDRSAPLVEDHLVGTAEPLRFVYRVGAASISELRAVFGHIFKPEMHALPSPVLRPDSIEILGRTRTARRRAA